MVDCVTDNGRFYTVSGQWLVLALYLAYKNESGILESSHLSEESASSKMSKYSFKGWRPTLYLCGVVLYPLR